MQAQARAGRKDAAAAHPLAELLACPPQTADLLNASAECRGFEGGEVVFRQTGSCQGLYVVVSGCFLRKTERMETRLTLGPVRPGDLVELAAVLGDERHTYTLTAQIPGSFLFLPMEALKRAFEEFPPLRMRLLEELAREVSRGYNSCRMSRAANARERGLGRLGP